MGRPSRPSLSRRHIVETALEMIDAEGLSELSIRRLAARLGVQGPSLYNHFDSKDDILDAVVDRVIGEVDVECFTERDWRDALRVWGHSYHDALASHPNIVPLQARGPGRRPMALAMADAVYGGLSRGGWPPGRATQVGAAMRYFVVGSASGSFSLGFPADPELYRDKYPHLSQAHELASHHAKVDERAFALGLEALLMGFQIEYDRLGLAPGVDATDQSAQTVSAPS